MELERTLKTDLRGKFKPGSNHSCSPPPLLKTLHLASVTWDTPLYPASRIIGTFSGGVILRTTDSLNSGLYLLTAITPPECSFALL